MTKRLRLVVSAVCALASLIVCMAYTGHVRGEAQRVQTEAIERYGGEVVSLVVAVRGLESGETVQVADVEERDWLSSLAPKDALLDMDDVVGREVSVPAAAGAPLTELNFRDATQLAEIPSGRVAVTIPVSDRLGIPPSVEVGSHVVMYRTNEKGAELVGSSAIVLAAPGSSVGTGTGNAGLTLAVMAQDVPVVLSSSTSGDLRVVVPADDVRELAEGASDEPVDVQPVKQSDDDAQGEQTRTDKKGEGE